MLAGSCGSGPETMGAAAGCRAFSRETLTSRPVDATLTPAEVARLVKLDGRAAGRLAGAVRDAGLRTTLRAIARDAKSKSWSSIEEWRNSRPVVALKARCRPYLRGR